MNLHALFVAVSLSLSLAPGVLESLCYVETGHKEGLVVEDKGSKSYGVCQIKLKAAREVGYRGRSVFLSDSDINIAYAGLYLKKQLKRYKGDYARAITAYNAGHSCRGSLPAYTAKVLATLSDKGWGDNARTGP